MAETGIEYATKTWNTTVGCEPVSPGCVNCWACRSTGRISKNPACASAYRRAIRKNPDTDLFEWTGKIEIFEKRLHEPEKWDEPQVVFVGSSSDLFHAGVPILHVFAMLEVMEKCPQHTFLLLTKRALRMARILEEYRVVNRRIPDNVIPGVSVENASKFAERMMFLREIDARRRWVSFEPLFGLPFIPDKVEEAMAGVHYAVIGGETITGKQKVRILGVDVARVLVGCLEIAGVPVHFKQWGDWVPGEALRGFPEESISAQVVAFQNGKHFTRKQLARLPAERVQETLEGWAMRVGKKTAGYSLDGRVIREAIPA